MGTIPCNRSPVVGRSVSHGGTLEDRAKAKGLGSRVLEFRV